MSAMQPDDGLHVRRRRRPVHLVPLQRATTTPCADARAAHKERMLGEHWRLLYVAMTRARDRLIVCGPQWQRRRRSAEVSWRARGGRSAANARRRADRNAVRRRPAPRRSRIDGRSAQAPKRSATALPAWARTPAPGAAQHRDRRALAHHAHRSGAVLAARRRAEALPPRPSDPRLARTLAGNRARAPRRRARAHG